MEEHDSDVLCSHSVEQRSDDECSDTMFDDECIKFLKKKLDAANATIADFEASRKQQRMEQERLVNEKNVAINFIEKMKLDFANIQKKNRQLEEGKDSENRLRLKCQDQIEELQQELWTEKEINKKIEGNLETLQEEIKCLHEKKQRMRNDAENFVTWFSSFEGYIEALMTEKNIYVEENKILKEKLMEKSKQIVEVNEKMENIKEELHENEYETVDLARRMMKFENVMDSFNMKYKHILENLSDMKSTVFTDFDKLQDKCYEQNIELQTCYKICEEYEMQIEKIEHELKDSNEQKLEFESSLTKANNEIDNKQSEIVKAEERFDDVQQHLTDLKMNLQTKEKELENLRRIHVAEETKNENLEVSFKNKATECEELKKYNEELKASTEDKKKDLNRERNSSKTLREENKKLNSEIKKSAIKWRNSQQQQNKAKMEIADLKLKLNASLTLQNSFKDKIEDLSKKLSQFENDNKSLTMKYEGMNGIIEVNEKDLEDCRRERDDLKEDLWQLRSKHIQTVTQVATAEEHIKKLEYNFDLETKKKDQLAKRTNEMEEVIRCSDEKIDDLEKAIWQKNIRENALQSKIEVLEERLQDVENEKDAIEQKAKENEIEYQKEKKKRKKQFDERCSEKDVEYEKQAKKREVLQIFIKKMDEQLKEKEMQLQVKKEELKRVLSQLASMRNDKERCSRKVESLILTEKTLSSKVQELEMNMKILEDKEKSSRWQLKQKENEIKKINSTWMKTTTTALESLGRDLDSSNAFETP